MFLESRKWQHAVTIVVAGAALAMPRLVCAQVNTGMIIGTVTDSTGAVLPGATITATDDHTSLNRSLTTNEHGRYQFAAMSPSDYSLEATLPGFNSVKRQAIPVSVGAVIEINLTMTLA